MGRPAGGAPSYGTLGSLAKMTAGGSPPRLDTVARVVLVVIGLSPLWVIPARSSPGLGWLAAGLDAWFGSQCHRAPGRMLGIDGLEGAVCARCLGIYLGLGLGGLAARPRLSARIVRFWMTSALGLMALDIGTELLALRSPNPLLRVFSGALLSYPAAVAAVRAARRFRWLRG